MKLSSFLAFAFLFSWATVAATATGRSTTNESPVQKVIQLMEGMMTKGKTEKHEETVQFAAYKQFCEDTTADKKRAIEEADSRIELLKADIEKHTQHAARLAKEIESHDGDIEAWTGDLNAATKVHNLEKSDYESLHTDYSQSVDALQRAIDVLKAQAQSKTQASLVQLSALKELSLVPDKAKKAIDAFIAQDPKVGLAVSAPEAYGYEFQSQGVVEMLRKLLDEFVSKRMDIEKEETTRKHEFEMLVQELEREIAQAKKDRTQKAAEKAERLQAKADAEGDLTDTTTTRAADQEYLDNLTTTCEQKATDFVARQQLRAEELVAIQKAIDIIGGDAVAGASEKYAPQLVQQGVSLAMLRASRPDLVQARAAQYLRERASALGSRPLSLLATHVAGDPFGKVKKMIKDLIVRLTEEANEETEHKGWCDTELSTNEQTRREKTLGVEALHAKVDELETSVAKLTEDIAKLTKELAELDGATAKATKLRQEEKAKNAQTISDAQAAQTATAQGLLVLKEFYAKSSEATALVQQQPRSLMQQQPTPPPSFDTPYQGMGGESGGVVSMLEVIESDFARLESDTETAEAEAQKEYEALVAESDTNKVQMSRDLEHKTAKKEDHSQALIAAKSDLEATQKELDAALEYFDKLKPSCIDAGESFEERTMRREQEIQSLQEALRILNNEDVA